MARRAADEVDERRISYHAQAFSALGFSIAEARSRAFTLYAYEVAESLLSNQGTESRKADRRTLLDQLVVLPLPERKAARQPARAPVTPTGSKVHKRVE